MRAKKNTERKPATKAQLKDLKPKKNPKGGLTFTFKLVAVKTASNASPST